MTSREIAHTLIKHKTCPDRVGIFEEFWQDTQSAWEILGERPLPVFGLFRFKTPQFQPALQGPEAIQADLPD